MTTAGLTALALAVVLVSVAPDLVLPLGAAAVLLLVVASAKSRMSYNLDFHDTAPDRERRYLRAALTSREEGKEIRLFGSRNLLMARHDRLFRQRIGEVGRVVVRRIRADVLGNLALTIVIVGVLLVISQRTNNGSLALANAAAAALAVQQLTSQLQLLATSAGSATEASLFVRDVSSFIARLGEAPVSEAPTGRVDALRLAHASFGYPGTDAIALHDVSLELSPGRIVAVVGENGSGKSTLAKVAAGLYAPTDGTVELCVDGNWHPVDGPLTGVVAAVFQDFARYELTASENVWLGMPSKPVDDPRLIDALATVRLTEAVASLPQGRETRLGRSFEGGIDLSIGQWQRLALARAIYSDAPVVLLDEPTSSADAQTESDFFSNLRTVLGDRAVLVVSHRFATVRDADEILVLNEGHLVERGTHRELMALNGVYCSMYELQAERMLGTRPAE
ncbi:MAG: ABC transporter ATP-binding protein [Acidimicrobiales bacterium]